VLLRVDHRLQPGINGMDSGVAVCAPQPRLHVPMGDDGTLRVAIVAQVRLVKTGPDFDLE